MCLCFLLILKKSTRPDCNQIYCGYHEMLSAEVCNWCVCVTASPAHLSGNDARKIKATDTWSDGQRAYVFSKIGIGWLPGFNSSAAPSARTPRLYCDKRRRRDHQGEKRRRNARRATAPCDKTPLLHLGLSTKHSVL